MKILLVLIAIVVVLGGVVAFRPSSFRVERRTVIAAPPSTVFAQVNDFHKWAAWNPWGKLDPTMKQTYEGAPAGVGGLHLGRQPGGR